MRSLRAVIFGIVGGLLASAGCAALAPLHARSDRSAAEPRTGAPAPNSPSWKAREEAASPVLLGLAEASLDIPRPVPLSIALPLARCAGAAWHPGFSQYPRPPPSA